MVWHLLSTLEYIESLQRWIYVTASLKNNDEPLCVFNNPNPQHNNPTSEVKTQEGTVGFVTRQPGKGQSAAAIYVTTAGDSTEKNKCGEADSCVAKVVDGLDVVRHLASDLGAHELMKVKSLILILIIILILILILSLKVKSVMVHGNMNAFPI